MKKAISWLERKEGNRFVEVHGLRYEDFVVGETYEHTPGRTITETDNIWQSLINMNTHPLHIDNEYAAKTEFKKPLVSSLVTFSIVGGLSLKSTSMGAIANLGWKNVNMPHPVFVGDTLRAESTIIGLRESKSRPSDGIVTVETRGYNQKNELVIEWERSFLVPKKVK
ncbi:MaoC family dehydratase [Vibrio sp. 10N.237.312.B06]|uniref:MaoC family dehydratase n=1 Tax=Vibrio sp. 10N.237.312.B06 TaxID=3229974 RepID=UPI00354F4AF2